jgi:large exoprotein involved in heme utilization and adhesion
VDVQVAGEMALTNRAEITTDSGLFSSTASGGNAGAITLEVGRLTLTDGAVISSTTFGPGRGGSVTVRASKALTLAGTDPMTGFPSGILATARGVGEGAGHAGMVLVEAATITLTDGAQLGSTTFGSGRGGSVTVRATEALTLKGFTLVDSSLVPTGISAGTLGAGDAGAVLVEASTITVTDGAQIGNVTFGSGRGGNVTVRATEAVTLKGSSVEGSFLSPSGISAVTLGQGTRARG